MLRHILDAHGGQPENLRICFQNTGLEHPATYEFILRVAEEWAIDVTWLEYCLDDEEKHDFKVVDFDSASRGGEPFTQLIVKKGYLPNAIARICTSNLKIRTLDRYLKTIPGFDEGYTNVVGLRYDEPRRVHRLRPDNGREEMFCPMYHAKHTEEDVLAWWKDQPFDLDLPLTGNMAGNCVGCFLKGRGKLEILMEEMPEHFDWWIKAEELVKTTAGTGARFRKDRLSYEQMVASVKAQGSLFPVDGEDTLPCMCTD